ncbi:hypothetical protein TWF506_008045 [Arthrobotrys conoides]|uniref:Uncharacterized protein n=1 Tax=Arthrobotrys conoides TaxID=74498 RepID=A0AAN8NMM9_9PEZI
MSVEFQNPYYAYGSYHHNPCTTGNCTSTVSVLVVHIATPIEVRNKYIVFLIYLAYHLFLSAYHFHYCAWAKPRKRWTVENISRAAAKTSKKTYKRVKEWSKRKVQKDLYIHPHQFERDETGPPEVNLKWREAVNINQMNRFRTGLRRRKVVRQNKFDWFE